MRILILLIGFCYTLNGQTSSLNVLALDSLEPNSSFIAFEINEQLICGGMYFDSEITRWTSFVSDFDESYDSIDVETIQDIPNLGIQYSNNILQGTNSIRCFTRGSEEDLVLMYDFENKALSIDQTLNRQDYQFSTNDINTFSKDGNIIFGGNSSLENGFPQGKVLSITEDSTYVYEDIDIENGNIVRHLRINESNQITLISQQFIDEKRHVYITLLDSNLNILLTTKNSIDQKEFYIGKGAIIDSKGDIIVTGHYVETTNNIPDAIPVLYKFDCKGRFIWAKELDFSTSNNQFFGAWNSIVESHELDGYIVAGANNYYNTNLSDSIFVEPSVVKINYEGDLIWQKSYFYRDVTQRLIEDFQDIVKTSDGKYFVVGSSKDFTASTDNIPWTLSIFGKLCENGAIDPISNIGNLFIKEKPKVFPNPAYKNVTFSFENFHLFDGSVYFYNSEGKEVFRSDIYNGKPLDISFLPEGLYFYILYEKNNILGKGKIVKL